MYYSETDNPTILNKNETFGGLDIIRIAPGDQKAVVDFRYTGDNPVKKIFFELFIKGEEGHIFSFLTQIEQGNEGTFEIYQIWNMKEYIIHICAYDKGSDKLIAKSPVRLLKTGVVPGTVINYIHPEDYTYNSSGRSPASPSIVRASDGRLFVSHDIYWKLGGQNISKVFVSEDNGASWKYLSDIEPCFWGKLLIHHDKLYMLGMSTEYGALLIYKSDDWGITWSEPVTILEAGSREKGGPHKAPMPIVEHKGRLWTAIDYGSWDTGGHASGVVSVPVDADLMDARNWDATPFLQYNSGWEGTITGGTPGLLEGNIVVTPEGELVNFLRYHTIGGTPDYGRAIMLRADQTNPRSGLEFYRVVDFPGNMTKFTIAYDEVSKRYYSLVNRVTNENLKQRNILTLVSSPDLIHWEIKRDVLNYEDNGWPEDSTKAAFQYVDWLFEGDNIIAVSRTAINGAYNYHNANHITFHRFRNFRR